MLIARFSPVEEFLIAPAGQLTALDVRAGTAAARAGLVPGDRLVSINGKPACSINLVQIRNLFRSPSGTVVHLAVRNKAGAERTVTLTLRD